MGADDDVGAVAGDPRKDERVNEMDERADEGRKAGVGRHEAATSPPPKDSILRRHRMNAGVVVFVVAAAAGGAEAP